MTAGTSSGTALVTLPTDTQILITREFDAPRRLVFQAWTVPELVERWWYAERGEMTGVEIDLRVGGSWRFAMVMPNGVEVAFHGEYREIVPDERLVWTEIYEGAPEAESLQTMILTERDGRTTMTVLAEHANSSDRDAVIASGMEDGLRDALKLLERVVVSLR
jgi:uncharacterized protein YndB with AHSA1/START domain